MSIRFAFFDIDGTLIDDRRELSPRVEEALAALRRRGIETVIATGRAPDQLRPIANRLGFDSYVCCNGALAVYRGDKVRAVAVPRDVIASFVHLADSKGYPVVVAGEKACYANRREHPEIREAYRFLGLPTEPVFDPDAWKREDVYQLYLFCKPGQEDPFLETYRGELRFIRPHRFYLDVFPAGVSKATGIDAILRHAGCSKEAAVAFGDSENDVEMLAYVGMGVAMGNAAEAAKRAAKRITAPVDEGGIYAALVDLGLIEGQPVP
ncbi:Cof-type HAD-IIB family hydrolase [Alicyclobacillus sendaiensis]|uniref:Cof-type HAD-IIB family hydrolase n=1 Tax=Alicyclobacillus sendaiensis TaxID=192387 RepID=UPI00078628CA|nr:Cof-type HAD-IIB family hydrolase [Alicyclobacillus sendaiensis]